MTHQCLTYLASSAALVSTLAFPTPVADDSHEDWSAYKSITNLSQQALNNVRSTINTINGVDPPPVTSSSRSQYPNSWGSNPYQDSWTPGPPYPTLPPDRPTTPQYYDPYYGGDHKGSEGGGVNAVALGLGLGIPLGIIACALAVFIFFWCRKRRKQNRHPFPMPFTKKVNDYETQLDSPAYSIHDPWLLDKNNLEINYSKKLGSGAFCNVFKGKINGEAPVSTIHPGQRTQQLRDCPVAVKMLPSFADDAARSDFMQEINFMKSLAYHPHLVSMLGFVADRKSPYLLVEFCEHGDLLHMIRNRRQEIIDGPNGNIDGLKIKDLLMYSWQISNGLEYLNNIGCIHRDIAARNVLVDSSNTCKIGDFGLCRLTDSLLYTARGGRLPLKWMAPESLSSYEYSFKSDVWSYGVLLWELFSLGEVPYAEVQTTELLQTHRSGKRLLKPEYCPEEIYDVMRSCWQELPDDRPAFQQTCAILAQMLENATENYGYLIPKHFNNQTRDPAEQCDNV
uniref:Protein kinase domain-containing protein n=1 Tax=Caenorhabditis tropicalis TaxID=1561998 RepID=A0A1I7V4I5_9PELO